MRPRTVLTVLFALAVAVVVASVIVLRNLNLDDYKDVIAAEVKDITGRDLEIKGDIGFVLSWSPTITVGQVALANAPWAAQREMLVVERLAVKFNLIELLTGTIDVTHVEVTGAKLTLERAKDGQANWDLKVTQPDIERTKDYLGGAFPYIKRALVQDLKIDYSDQASGETLSGLVESLKVAVRKNGHKLRLEFDAMVRDHRIFGSSRLTALQALHDGGSSPVTASLLVGAAKLDLDGTVGQRNGSRALDLKFNSSGPEITDLALVAGYTVPAIGPYDITGRVVGLEDGTEFRDLDARVGRSDLKGTVKITAGDPLGVVVDLTSGVLDLTPLFQGVDAVDDTQEDAAGDDDQIYSDAPLPFDSLAAVDADIKLTVKRLLVRGSWFDVAKAQVTLKGGDLKVDPFKLNYRGATFTGRGSIDGSATSSAVKVRLLTQNFDLGSFLKEQNVTDVVAGNVDFGLDVTGKGNSPRAIIASLDGKAGFVSGKGEIASRYIDLLAVDLLKFLAPWEKGLTEAKVTCALGQLTVKQGKVTSQALLLDTENIRMKGSGTLELPTDKINLLLWPRPKDPTLVTLATPLRVKGTLGHTTLEPAPLGLALDAAEAAAGVLLFGPAGILIPFVSLGAGHHHDCVNDLQKVFGTQVGTELADDSDPGAGSPGYDSTDTSAASQPVPSEMLFPIKGDKVMPDLLTSHLAALGFTKIGDIEKEGAIFHLTADWQGKLLKLRVDADLGRITVSKDPG